MQFRKTRDISVGFFALALLVSGCSSSVEASNSGSETSPKIVDIKDIILTNLSADCADYSSKYEASVTDLKRDVDFVSQFEVSEDGQSCNVQANDIPNYDFNDASANWAEPIATQGLQLTIPRNPKLASEKTALDLSSYNAVMLNGVVLDQLANGCYKPSDPNADRDGNIANGCGPSVDWRLDPMGKVKFGTDSHNGHTQPGGLYHYHGSPNALYDPEETDQGSPVIGFAADGFPIYGPHYIDEKTGKMLVAISGYTLKKGNRPSSSNSPGGAFDGTYIQDYEFTEAGTLDECNGMTVKGQYGYYVTSSYPYVMGCYSGVPNQSFAKASSSPWIISAWAAIFFAPATAITLILFYRRKIFQPTKTNPLTQTEKGK